MKITQRPYKFCFSKNPVQYTFSGISNYAEDGCYLLIQIYKRDIGGANEVLLYQEQIKPLTDTVVYDMASIVESALEYSLPDFTGAILQAGGNIKEFYVKFGTITDAAPSPTYTSDAANFIYGIKGGIPQPQWDWNNYFINYVAANKPFLTWQPNNRFIGLNDSFFISFLNSLTTTPLSLMVDAEYIDGTTEKVITNFEDTTSAILYHIQAGPDQLGLNALHPDKRLYKYSLSVVSAANNAVAYANPYTYYIDYRKFYNTKFLHYYNSLGGIEAVRINGTIETTADVTFTESERYGGNVIIGAPNLEEYTQTAKNKVDSFKGDSGYIFTAKEQDVFQEILLSRFAWERIISKSWRIYVTNKSTSMRKTSDKTFSIPLEWRYSFSNSVYAPVIDLGIGHDYNNYCTPVNTIGTPSLPDAVASVAYYYVFGLTGDVPMSITSSTKPPWMAIDIVSNSVVFSGTPGPEDVGTDIAISVTFNNCGLVPKVFTDTISVSCISFTMDAEMPAGQVGLAYSYTRPIIGVEPFTVTVIDKPSWMSIDISGSNIVFTGTPDAAGGTNAVAFTLNSCTTLDYTGNIQIAAAAPADYFGNVTTSENSVEVTLEVTLPCATTLSVNGLYNNAGSLVPFTAIVNIPEGTLGGSAVVSMPAGAVLSCLQATYAGDDKIYNQIHCTSDYLVELTILSTVCT